MMIGIDMTFILQDDSRDKILASSLFIFISELLDAFADMQMQNRFCLIIYPWQAELMKERFPEFDMYILDWKPARWVHSISGGRFKCRNLRKRFAFKRKNALSCVWFPFVSPEYLWKTKLPAVCTIHDLILFHNTKDNPKLRKAFESMIGLSSCIVAISEHTKDDVLASLDYDRSRIHVIPNSIHLRESQYRKPPEIQRKYILDINGYGPHKNALTLLKAFAQIADSIDLDLVFCGGWRYDTYWNLLEAFIQEHNLSSRVHLYFAIPEEYRNWLLKNAALFVTPSTNEGFGRTPVEAAICGVPVISTKAASLYSVTKGLVHYYEDPCNETELAQLMLKCIHQPDPPEKLKEIAQTLKEEYAPKSCAMKYWEILKTFNHSQKIA